MLPAGITFQQSSQGVVTTNNTVVTNIGTLNSDQQGTFSVVGVAQDQNLLNTNLVANATFSFTNPDQSQNSVVAYTMNTIGLVNQTTNNNLAGFAFGSGFFPTSLLGWVILIGIIIVLVLMSRMLINKSSTNAPVNTDHSAH